MRIYLECNLNECSIGYCRTPYPRRVSRNTTPNRNMSTSVNQNITSGLGSPQNWADLFIESSYIQEQSKHIVHNAKDILNEKK
nr:MAG TPA: hypothetical protein [Caudoviricetes sp.]